jgi:hypothetical protein
LKQGEASSPLLLNFTLGYAIRRFQANQKGFNLNGTHQILVYTLDVNILDGGVPSVQKNTDALVVASKEIGLEVNAEKSK